MNPETEEAGKDPVDQLLDRVIQYCNRLFVARRERLEFVALCTTLSDRLNDRSLTPRHPKYDTLKSQLTEAEGRLERWSRCNFIKRLIKRRGIKAGITVFIGNLEQIINDIQNRRPPSRQTGEGSRQQDVRTLDGEVIRQGRIPFAEGVFGEVWEGRWEKCREGIGEKETDNKKVALKVLRTFGLPEKAPRARQRLMYELSKRAGLRHQNVLPFYGVFHGNAQSQSKKPRLYMVFPWRENGNLLDYVRNNPGVDKDHLLRGSAAGLSYLHSKSFVHGNVKCRNVLITKEGDPQICDFEVARIMGDIRGGTSSTSAPNRTFVRHAAPELIKDNQFRPTARCDTYSFAMLILECITEQMPFSNITREAKVIHAKISKNQRPPRPDGNHHISNELWELMNHCWSAEPGDRPSMDHVHRFFLDQA